MPRLFIALPVSEEVRSRAGSVQIPEDASIRRTAPDEFHVTLHFLGETDQPAFERVRDELSLVQSPSFPLTLAGAGHFPPTAADGSSSDRDNSTRTENSPRVLWIGVRPSDKLISLHQNIGEVLSSVGIRTEERPYHPHLTVARIKPGAGVLLASRAAEMFETDNAGFHVIQTVDRFILFSVARDSASRPRYVVEREYPLKSC
ncbi:MAG: 2'-5' RNA ligase family protein [Planctomycetaceae bacterium]|nr:2'-5' RNA ligase family protein [Planctomycetaceae bacterium]